MEPAGWVFAAMGGSMALALPVAVLAALVSSFSPCVVPPLPGYLSYLTGMGVAEVAAGHRRGRMLIGTLLFVLGLAVVFVVAGFAFGAFGQLLNEQRTMITKVLGAVFALGWTPCIGPALAVVLNLGLNEGTALRGGVLGFAYALGPGIPFVIAGLAFTAMNRTVGLLRRHQVALIRIGGLMMVAVGLLLVTGLWDQLMARLTVGFGSYQTVI